MSTKKYKEKLSRVGEFGKDLARRSKSKCELCGASKVKLVIYELPPIPKEPDFNNCIFICEECLNKLNNLNKIKENDLRFLENSIWSELPIIKAISISLLKLIQNKFPWAEDVLYNGYVEKQDLENSEKIIF